MEVYEPDVSFSDLLVWIGRHAREAR
jgi:hypothetical protein